MINWYVLHTKPFKEKFVDSLLSINNIESFYLQIRTQTLNLRSHTFRSYFPGYTFIRTDIEKCTNLDFRWLPGVVGLVCFDSHPATVEDIIIKQIRNYLDKVNALAATTSSNIQSGEKVIIHDGLFKGYEGIFDHYLSSSNRVCILMKLLSSRMVSVRLSADLITIKK